MIEDKVREGFLDSRVIPDTAFHGLHIPSPISILPIYGKNRNSLSLHCCCKTTAGVRLDQVVLQYTHDECSSVTIPGFPIIGLSSLTSWQEVVQAEMLPYMTSTNRYYFPAVIVPVLVLCLHQSRSANPCGQ